MACKNIYEISVPVNKLYGSNHSHLFTALKVQPRSGDARADNSHRLARKSLADPWSEDFCPVRGHKAESGPSRDWGTRSRGPSKADSARRQGSQNGVRFGLFVLFYMQCFSAYFVVFF